MSFILTSAAFEELIRGAKPSPDTSVGAGQGEVPSLMGRSYSAEHLEEEPSEYEGIEVREPRTPK